MKISLDGGALCGSGRFGNYFFSENLIKALSIYDKKNDYWIYSFCQRPPWLDRNLVYQDLRPKKLWMNFRVALEENLFPKDVFLALNQSLPFFFRSKKIISFSHGLSFHFYPKYYPDSVNKMAKQLEDIVGRSDKIVVSSKKVEKEIANIFPKLNKIEVIPFGVPFDMLVNSSCQKKDYFLFVGMNHPIKNIEFLVKVFKKFISDKKYRHFKLRLVGDYSDYADNKNVFSLGNLDRINLKRQYSQATAYLTASYYESFNLPVLEALSCGTQVVGMASAIIPEFDPYVLSAKDEEQFVSNMSKTVEERTVSEAKKIKEKFSWKKYVESLLKLYD
ncbi:glycosyltransferase family 4 protein [Candidatus Roizmanbacteria bacterium]|jgi:glycosyltransferase involved in cell wall biosynthesis|nr:glycosyltransferase family 4 protein [Candidatus Roizmanbacteria bacterium]